MKFLVTLITGVLGAAPTVNPLDEFEIFAFIREEDLAPPPPSSDYMAAYEQVSRELSDAKAQLANLHAFRAQVQNQIDSLARSSGTQTWSVQIGLKNNHKLSPNESAVAELISEIRRIDAQLEDESWKVRNATLFIQWNKPNIEAYCRRIVETGYSKIQRLNAEREEAVRPLARARELRSIVANAIESEHIKAPVVGVEELDESTRAALIASVTRYITSDPLPNEKNVLTKILKGELRFRGYEFLHHWIAFLNRVHHEYKTRVAPRYTQLRLDFEAARNLVMRARAIVFELVAYSSATPL